MRTRSTKGASVPGVRLGLGLVAELSELVHREATVSSRLREGSELAVTLPFEDPNIATASEGATVTTGQPK